MFRGAAVLTITTSLLVTLSFDSEDQKLTVVTLGKCMLAIGGNARCRPYKHERTPSTQYRTNASEYNLTALPPRVVFLNGGPISLDMALTYPCLVLRGRCAAIPELCSVQPLPKQDLDAVMATAFDENGVVLLIEMKRLWSRTPSNRRSTGRATMPTSQS